MFTEILDFKVFNKNKDELIKYIGNFEKVNIISGNPEILFNGLNDSLLKKSFNSEHSIIIPDGVGTVLASKILKKPVEQKIAGIDVMKDLLKKANSEKKSIYLLGAKEEVVQKCSQNIKLEFPNLNLVGIHNGFFDLENCKDIIDDIKCKKPWAIFVAMGCPRQEYFIENNINILPCKIFMGVGGSFDIFAGISKRAPKWMISLGLEWLYRVVKEPWRITRLASIPKFLITVLKHRNKNR
ncbi:WecB/TagA/CpsF family glycosyltransferase [Clostridium uliginosum]|uniref:N-acetylglucosaminyldiphosphoundecaprenol N-acetyl-beta-D-mannosaminyltransferase n=1 Tax=Clostridium uliginosum TaxID=119641 RepID=A0A1I1K679_9CLOT|nr:WecB/TagA/CpsF family glycosyltransferase [Clostridium uliginosum]SFC54218.1 N-acetylglucosaminyldiphosphoundecaprenol N-acetyl-beta-D-mannosaminyltransferase [Clostridium uliginosum]